MKQLRPPYQVAPCIVCGALTPVTNTKLYQRMRKGRMFCSDEHMTVLVNQEKMRRLRRYSDDPAWRKMHSERMKSSNPMADMTVRARVRTTLRAMGWKPPVHGGNGRGPTAPQLALAAALGWAMEVVVSTHPRPPQHPQHYKLDIANEALKVAVEVDGGSHCALKVKAADARKDAFLRGRGWTVLRFSNREVTERLADCVRTVLSTI